ncbi:hypothetical protein M413DRAFT_449641 [Hebeloma cylindrosporum]|uniref:Uncharacterized protein n=1 Tax=Hebeloma cylindrosporum TaxID=76867 RepID=A0A0C2XCH0_HEBCY|nr:hypothetical protein M413DRAFT_449641 [Hebeloma cylindrosporum h7]
MHSQETTGKQKLQQTSCKKRIYTQRQQEDGDMSHTTRLSKQPPNPTQHSSTLLNTTQRARLDINQQRNHAPDLYRSSAIRPPTTEPTRS